MFRKFFTDGAAEGAGGGAAAAAPTTTSTDSGALAGMTQGQSVNLMELMGADSGGSAEEDEPQDPPAGPQGSAPNAGSAAAADPSKPVTGQEGAGAAAQAGTGAASSNTEGAGASAPKEGAQAEGNFQEVLLKQDKTTVLKALGYTEAQIKVLNGLDEFETSLIESRRAKGNLNDYFQAAATNWDEVPDAEVMRQQLRERYPKLSEAAFQKLYDKEVTSAYAMGELETAEDKEIGAIKLKEAADSVREAKKIAQAKLLDSGRSTEAEALRQQQETERKTRLEEQAQFESEVRADPRTQNILKTKQLELSNGVKVAVDPNKLIGAALNAQEFFSIFALEGGKYDLENFFATVNYALNRKQVEADQFNAGKSANNKEVINEHVNPSLPAAIPGGIAQESLGRAINNGKRTTVGEFLQD
jgi:hypothetical protein